jgi:hypothetical protein
LRGRFISKATKGIVIQVVSTLVKFSAETFVSLIEVETGQVVSSQGSLSGYMYIHLGLLSVFNALKSCESILWGGEAGALLACSTVSRKGSVEAKERHGFGIRLEMKNTIERKTGGARPELRIRSSE